MNDQEKKVAAQVARNLAIFVGVKFVILYGISRAARKAAQS